MSLWARGFWKSYCIALQRAEKDTRARSFVFRVTVLLVYLLAYVSFICFMEIHTAAGAGIWTAGFYTFIYGMGTIAAILIRRSHRKQDEILNYSLTGQSRLHPLDAADVSPAVRAYLEERTLIVASLLARGGSEIYLESNQLAPGMEVVTRQIQNSFLRERGLWEKLEQEEVELAILADGRWSQEQRNRVTSWCEQLRLLRWALRVDSELVSLAHFPTLTFSLAREVLQREVVARENRPVLKSWDVRVHRDIAAQYTARVVAELKGRGLIANSPDLDGWADEFRAKSLGSSTDYLAGAKTIEELDDVSLRLLGSIASARERYCGYLADQLNAVQPFSFSTWTG